MASGGQTAKLGQRRQRHHQIADPLEPQAENTSGSGLSARRERVPNDTDGPESRVRRSHEGALAPIRDGQLTHLRVHCSMFCRRASPHCDAIDHHAKVSIVGQAENPIRIPHRRTQHEAHRLAALGE